MPAKNDPCKEVGKDRIKDYLDWADRSERTARDIARNASLSLGYTYTLLAELVTEGMPIWGGFWARRVRHGHDPDTWVMRDEDVREEWKIQKREAARECALSKQASDEDLAEQERAYVPRRSVFGFLKRRRAADDDVPF